MPIPKAMVAQTTYKVNLFNQFNPKMAGQVANVCSECPNIFNSGTQLRKEVLYTCVQENIKDKTIRKEVPKRK